MLSFPGKMSNDEEKWGVSVVLNTSRSSNHWRQPRRGCRGHIPPNILVGERQREYPPILLRTFGYSRPILVAQTLPTEPPKGVRCGEGCSLPTPHPIRWFVPPTLNSRCRHWLELSRNKESWLYTGWQWRNFDSYLCRLVFAAILWVKLSTKPI